MIFVRIIPRIAQIFPKNPPGSLPKIPFGIVPRFSPGIPPKNPFGIILENP